MKKPVNDVICQVRENGFCVLPEVYQSDQCNTAITLLRTLQSLNLRGNISDKNSDTVVLRNPFRFNKFFFNFIFNSYLDSILRQLIDVNYVLINTNAINRQSSDSSKQAQHGDRWHSDSRIVGGRAISNGFNFIVAIMLEDFGPDNAPTEILRSSHLLDEFPTKDALYCGETILGDAGSVAIIDAATWHRGGQASTKSRWSIFNMYGPWFMKPYFDFPQMLVKHNIEISNKNIQRLLHLHSSPPVDESIRISTLLSVES